MKTQLLLVVFILGTVTLAGAARPGEILALDGVRGKYPIVFLPGIMASNLQVWKLDCARGDSQFRSSLWVDPKFALLHKKCFMKAISLNKDGLDNEGVAMRPLPSLDGAEFIGPSSLRVNWVFKYIILNLADIGYTTKDLDIMTYDWRLSLENLEFRDRFFTILKNRIELLRIVNDNKKVVLSSHSMGSITSFAFMKWVESEHEGWVQENLHAFVPMSAPFLGATKAIRAAASGDMHEFEAIPRSLYKLKDLHTIAKSWSSFITLWPKGGERIWGSLPISRVNGMDLPNKKDIYVEALRKVFDADQMSSLLEKTNLDMTPTPGQELPGPEGVYTWVNPLITPLPKAPELTIYNLYGVGIDTESGYDFTVDDEEEVTSINDKSGEDGFRKGVRYTDGDGSVNLISMGYMTMCGWKNNRLNPAGVKLITREYKDKWSINGSLTSSHARILGNYELITDILNIAAGRGEMVEQRIESDLERLIRETGTETHPACM